VLETGTFMRVGSTQVQETDVRIIAATNRNPADAVAKGKLREDLLYRLNVFPIHLPPLRERVDDIPLIAQHFLEQIGEREGAARSSAPTSSSASRRTAGRATCASCATSSTAPT
jgi:transcriptional regulator with GAF, ATPase, and Fis domain